MRSNSKYWEARFKEYDDLFNPNVDSKEFLQARYEKIKENNLNFENYLKSYFSFDVIIKPPKF